MSAKSKKSNKDLDRPFACDLVEKARGLAHRYQIILDYEDDTWYGRGLELPNVFGEGSTVGKCVTNVREALTATVATMLENGQIPPIPADKGARSEQVNIRLTPNEKAVLEAKARREGFRGVSDLMRTAALSN